MATYLAKEESFMYDREHRFPMEETYNAAILEYGVTALEQRRCDILQIGQTGAILKLITSFNVPREFYLNIPDARIAKASCILMKINPNNTILARFLRPISERDLHTIFVYSTHPKHRNKLLQLR